MMTRVYRYTLYDFAPVVILHCWQGGKGLLGCRGRGDRLFMVLLLLLFGYPRQMFNDSFL